MPSLSLGVIIELVVIILTIVFLVFHLPEILLVGLIAIAIAGTKL